MAEHGHDSHGGGSTPVASRKGGHKTLAEHGAAGIGGSIFEPFIEMGMEGVTGFEQLMPLSGKGKGKKSAGH